VITRLGDPPGISRDAALARISVGDGGYSYWGHEDFHANGCQVDFGITGRAMPKLVNCERWRRNGATQTWKTRPNDFRIPVKHGLYAYWEITADNANEFHLASQCPAEKLISEELERRAAIRALGGTY